MSRPPCTHPGCPRRAEYRIVGANLARPAEVCEQHLGAAQRSAGMPRGTEAIVDDGQDALFDLAPP